VTDAEIAIDVVDEHGLATADAWVVPVDCDGLQPGPPRVTRVPLGTCTVRAMRRDGALFARSEPVTVEVTADDVAYVLLELASTRTGGIGVRFLPGENGMRVLDVVEGSPADEAGLHPGDLVIDVGGEPTAGMDADTFVERMTGAEGTDVTFTVGWSDDTGTVEETVTVRRRFLDG
jgi:C-terminal processing protease CtpA/Prc